MRKMKRNHSVVQQMRASQTKKTFQRTPEHDQMLEFAAQWWGDLIVGEPTVPSEPGDDPALQVAKLASTFHGIKNKPDKKACDTFVQNFTQVLKKSADARELDHRKPRLCMYTDYHSPTDELREAWKTSGIDMYALPFCTVMQIYLDEKKIFARHGGTVEDMKLIYPVVEKKLTNG